MCMDEYLVILSPAAIIWAIWVRHWLDQGLAELRHQSFKISFLSSSKLDQWQSLSWFFIQFRRFSMGLRSGEFQCQSITFYFLFASQSWPLCSLWHGVPSWRNLLVLVLSIAGPNRLLRTFRQDTWFIICPLGRKESLPQPFQDSEWPSLSSVWPTPNYTKPNYSVNSSVDIASEPKP